MDFRIERCCCCSCRVSSLETKRSLSKEKTLLWCVLSYVSPSVYSRSSSCARVRDTYIEEAGKKTSFRRLTGTQRDLGGEGGGGEKKELRLVPLFLSPRLFIPSFTGLSAFSMQSEIEIPMVFRAFSFAYPFSHGVGRVVIRPFLPDYCSQTLRIRRRSCRSCLSSRQIREKQRGICSHVDRMESYWWKLMRTKRGNGSWSREKKPSGCSV